VLSRGHTGTWKGIFVPRNGAEHHSQPTERVEAGWRKSHFVCHRLKMKSLSEARQRRLSVELAKLVHPSGRIPRLCSLSDLLSPLQRICMQASDVPLAPTSCTIVGFTSDHVASADFCGLCRVNHAPSTPSFTGRRQSHRTMRYSGPARTKSSSYRLLY